VIVRNEDIVLDAVVVSGRLRSLLQLHELTFDLRCSLVNRLEKGIGSVLCHHGVPLNMDRVLTRKRTRGIQMTVKNGIHAQDIRIEFSEVLCCVFGGPMFFFGQRAMAMRDVVIHGGAPTMMETTWQCVAKTILQERKFYPFLQLREYAYRRKKLSPAWIPSPPTDIV